MKSRWAAFRRRSTAKKLDPKEPVTTESLIKAGVVRRAKDGVRLLSGGELKAKRHLRGGRRGGGGGGFQGGRSRRSKRPAAA